MISSSAKGYSFSLFGAAGSGFFTVLYLKAGENVDPLFAVFMLFFWALVYTVFFELFFSSDKKAADSNTKPLKSKKNKALMVAVSFGLILLGSLLGNYFYQIALKFSEPVLVQLATRFEIIFVVFVGWLIFHEQLTLKFWVGVLLVFSGFLITNADHGIFKLSSWYGIILGILSGISFGTFQAVSKKLVGYFTPLQINKYRLIVNLGAMFFLPGIIAGLSSLTIETVFYTALAAFTGPFCSRLAYIYALQYVPVSHTIMFTALSPFFTGFLQVVFLGIPLTLYEFIGMFFITVGIIVAVWHKRHKTNDTTRVKSTNR